jgi:hypothetical protein
MIKYVIAMKSGFSFIVEVESFKLFVEEMKMSIKPGSTNNFHAAGGVMFSINDISAIYPLSAQQNVQQAPMPSNNEEAFRK